jgi:hypothetical protein
MKIRPVGDELFHADRRTDMTKLIVAFRNFAKAPEKTQISSGNPLRAADSKRQGPILKSTSRLIKTVH